MNPCFQLYIDFNIKSRAVRVDFFKSYFGVSEYTLIPAAVSVVLPKRSPAHLYPSWAAVSLFLPAGSAVSDLLDDRLRRLQQQLQESNKSCEGLASQVEAFNKCAREVSRSASIKTPLD